MDDVNSLLVDWSIRFIENRDIIRREIVNIEKNARKPTDNSDSVSGTNFVGKEGFDFVVYYKDKTWHFNVKLALVEDIFTNMKEEDYIGVITLNNATNIKFVVSNWKKLVNFKFLSIYFINPFSSSDKVWIIRPYIHDKICDKASLELGLKSMAEMVNPLDTEELKRKLY